MMYIEVIHDPQGNIVGCYCVDTLPVQNGRPLFTMIDGIPDGLTQARVNIDTLTAMEIDGAVSEVGERSHYIVSNYRVNMENSINPPASVQISEGMKVRGLIRKV